MIRQRVVSAVVVAMLLLSAILLLPPLWSAAALSALLLAAAWEWSGLLRARAALRPVFILTVLLMCAVVWNASRTAAQLQWTLCLALAFWIAALLWLALAPQRVNTRLVWLAGLLALPLAWVALLRMRIDWPHGREWVLYVLLIVWVADSGAFFAGKRWGVTKMAPRVSPGKTWAGLIGGLLAAALLGAACSWLLHVHTIKLVPLTVCVALFSAVGDLTESLFKRFAGVKDSGNLIPGHGGVLDRFDSLLAAAPSLMLGVLLVGGPA
jgi:phosphatidate cytidylyltransferase